MAQRQKGRVNCVDGVKISSARKERILQKVAPLVVQGWGCTRIARELGISENTARLDVKACHEIWEQQHSDSRDEWNGRLLAQYRWMMGELSEVWAQSKQGRITRIINPDGTELIRQEPPDPRWMSGMLAVGKEISTFLGIREGVDNVSRVEVPEETRAALAPMTQDAYLAMVASSGGLPQINAVPPIDRREETEPETIEMECLDELSETTVDEAPIQEAAPEPPRTEVQATPTRVIGGSALPRFVPRRRLAS